MKLSEIVGLKKGTWSPDEDQQLIACIKRCGIMNWSMMPIAAGLSRSGKSCRLRWMNYLRPDLKRDRFSMEEVETIIKTHESLGNKWSKIAAQLPGRTDNEIKNFWHTHAKKYLKSNSTVPGANHCRPKRSKHKERRVIELKSSLNHGAKESNLETSSTSAESTQFFVVESYSPCKDSDAACAGNDMLENVKSSETQRKIQENFLMGPFCMEDVYLPEINSTIFEEASSAYLAHEWEAHASNNDDLTSFWFNIFLEANNL